MTDWRSLPLTECLEKSPKVSKVPKKKFLEDGQFPIVSQEQGLVNGYWNDECNVVRIDRPVVIYGDHTQIVKLVDFDFVVGADGVKLLKPKKFLEPKYFYYFLLANPVKGLGYARHFRLLKELSVRFPSLTEQKRIVAIFDEAFVGIETAIANTKKNLANARELFDRYLNSEFEAGKSLWDSFTLSDICDFENGDRGKNYPNKSALVSSGVPFVNAGHLSDGFVSLQDMGYIKEERYELLGSGKFVPGDILFCLRGSLGKFGVVGDEVGNGAIASSLVIVRPKAGANSTKVRTSFLVNYFRSKACAEMISKYAGGAAQPNLGARDLAKFEIHLPPIVEQERLDSKIEEIDRETRRLKSIYMAKLASLNELKQSLLQKAFSGELTASRRVVVDDAMQEAVTA